MLQVHNQTPFAAELSVLPAPDARETLYVVVQATFELGEGGLRVAEEQRPIVPGDEYRGDPASSSLRFAGQVHPCKPATDVVLLGAGYAPGGKPAPYFGVSLMVGKLRKLLHVYGDRVWSAGLTGAAPSEPIPTTSVPLIWERAYGGTVRAEDGEELCEPRNPVGVGFLGGRSPAQLRGMPVPNLDDPRNPIVGLAPGATPVGFGFIGPSWQPRVAFAGTYDEAWRRTRAPFLPDDFDPRFLQAAPPDQIYPGALQGGEPVEIINASPVGVQRFALPTCELVAAVSVAGRVERPRLCVETLALEPDQARLSMLWRGAVPCEKEALRIEQVSLELRSLKGARS